MDQLAVGGHRLNTLQHIIDRKIKLDNCYHDKIQSRKVDAPNFSKNTTPPSKHVSNQPSKKTTSTPSPLKAVTRSKAPQEITLILSNDGVLKQSERARREKEGLCMYCGGNHSFEECAKRLACQSKSSLKN